MQQIKGEKRTGRPIALTLSFEEFVPMIDMSRIPKDLKQKLDPETLKHSLGSLCFLRVPLDPKHHHNVPEHAKSYREDGVCLVQNWDSYGHTPTELFLEETRKLGVTHPGVTSMNISGQPEIVDQKEGERFCQQYGIPLFLKDPDAHPDHVGSYTILSIDRYGIRLERDGNIPGRFFEKLLQSPIDVSQAKAAKYPHIDFPENLFEQLAPHQVRNLILFSVQPRLNKKRAEKSSKPHRTKAYL